MRQSLKGLYDAARRNCRWCWASCCRAPDGSAEGDDTISDIVAQRFDAGIRLGEMLDRDMIAIPISGDLEMAAAWLANGQLERVLADWAPRFPGLYLYYPGRRQIPPVLRAFVDFLHHYRSGVAAS
jgi:DNA-binding transcriptional LysR family regulator